MAFTPPTMATDNISSQNPEPNDVGGLTDAQLQALFDKFGVDFKAYFINHLAELASITAGSSASENLGSATIAGLTGNTVYAQLVNMLAIAQAAQAGTILPGTVTDTMLSNTAGQIKDTVTTHLADYVRQPAFAATTGVANTYAISTDPAPTAYVDGMSAYLDINIANTGASTLNWNGLGAKNIVTSKGVALTAGKLPLNSIIGVRYNASAGNFQLLGEGGEYGTAGAPQVLPGYTIGTDSGLVTGTYSNIKSIQRGTATLTTNPLTVTITGVDTSKAIVRLTYTGATGGTLQSDLFQAVLTNSTTLSISCGYTANYIVHWEVIEFNNVKSLQSGTKAISSTTDSITVTSVNTSKTMLFFSQSSSSSSTKSEDTVTDVYLNNATTINISQINAISKTIAWVLIEFN